MENDTQKIYKPSKMKLAGYSIVGIIMIAIGTNVIVDDYALKRFGTKSLALVNNYALCSTVADVSKDLPLQSFVHYLLLASFDTP